MGQEGERIVIVPEDLVLALSKSSEAKAAYEKLSYSNKKEYVRWVTEAKRLETRTRRVSQTVEKLEQGLKNPYLK
jgi:uncharacterized protein YdeI (YjbR/CyaY-like superfamily)